MKPDLGALAELWTGAFNAGDMTGLAGCYAPDAVVHPPGRRAVKGRDDIRAFFAEIRAQGFRHYRLVVDEEQTRGRERLLSGRWSVTGFDADGEQQRYEGNWLNVIEGEDDDLRIVAHMWN